MSEWKLRRLIQDGLLPYLHDGEGAPFLLDVRDLDEYVERNKHHESPNELGLRTVAFPAPANSPGIKRGVAHATPPRNRKPVSKEGQHGVVDQVPPQRKLFS
jgi:hypothetical protein